MSAEDDGTIDDAQPPHGEFVAAVIARTMDEAEALREFLEDHDIPVILGNQPGRRDSAKGGADAGPVRGVPVLVPEELLDEASEIIAECGEMDEYEVDEDDDLDDEEDEEGLELELGGGKDAELEDEEEEDDEEDDEGFLLDDEVEDEVEDEQDDEGLDEGK